MIFWGVVILIGSAAEAIGSFTVLRSRYARTTSAMEA